MIKRPNVSYDSYGKEADLTASRILQIEFSPKK
jgi:hypothetical protein